MHNILQALLLYLALAATASPISIERTTSITAADILKIAPEASTCANPPAPGECRTASQAAPYIGISFTNFGIKSFNTQAALLALMLYESDNFKYAKNHFPGVPGQGTRNMQSPENNSKYAQWLATVCTNCGITEAEVKSAEAKGPAALLNLVNTDEWSFGSAAWYLSTQCDPSVKEGLAAGTQQGWEAYLSGCVQTTVTAKRTAIWKKAIALKAW